ncbi:hypothetical protein ATCC90586_009388 [Pythium insidiosum]|nr:hypothetical protein ATCC90586_009388 [Pythium insidiosum]
MTVTGASAWEQWGGKRATGGVMNGAQDAFQSLLRGSPLSSTASTASSDGEPTTGPSFSMKKMWDSAQNLAKTGSINGAASDADAMENGAAAQASAEGDDTAEGSMLPLWRKKTAAKSSSVLPTVGWNTRFKYFVGLTLMAVMFFGMASIFLPLIMIRPSKFALSFTLGSMCAMGAFAMLKGPAAYAKDLLQPKTLALTTAYFLTLGSTLYSCLILGSYVMVVASSVCQLITLFIFALSALPGGNASLKAFGALFMKAARQMVRAFMRLLS